MKSRSLIIIAVLSCSLSLNAQINISTSSLMVDKKSVPALETQIELSVDASRDYFEDFMKERYDARVKGNGFLSGNKTLTVEQQTLSSIHENAIDMFIDFKEITEKQSKMFLAARNGYDLYFDSNYAADSRDRLKDLMRSYEDYALQRHYQSILEEEQDLLENLLKTQKKKEKDISKNEKDIANNLKENQKLEKENDKLRQELETSQKKLEEVKENLKAVKTKLN